MTQVIGPFTLTGTPAQNATISGMATKLTARLALPVPHGWRVEPIDVVFLPNDQMPYAAEPSASDPNGTRARGFWRVWPHRILLNASIGAYPVAKTFAHEVMHALDDDWVLPTQRAEIKRLMEPVPSGWRGETFAIYASAAVAGFNDPPYADFYGDRKIPATKWAALKEIVLRDDMQLKIDELLRRVTALESEGVVRTEEIRVLTAKGVENAAEITRLQGIVDRVKEAVA